MRVLSLVAVAIVVVVALAPTGARAASGETCAVDTDCAAGQACADDDHTCVFAVLTRDDLVAAINTANLDAARDVILVGNAHSTDAVTIAFDDGGVAANVDGFGPVGTPVITTPITVRGQNAATAKLDANTAVRMFFVAVTTTTSTVQPDLTLAHLSIVDARPGADAAGNFVGGGVAHVANTKNASGLAATFTARDVLFSSCGDDGSPADAVVSFAGGDVLLDHCTFDANVGVVAGAVVSSATQLRIVGGTYSNNHSDAGAGVASVATDTTVVGNATFTGNTGGAVGGIDATTATRTDGSGALVAVRLSIGDSSFLQNQGGVGAVRSLATTTLNNDTFDHNVAHDSGGAVLARNLHVSGGVFTENFASIAGGAVASLDVPPSDLVRIENARFSNNASDGVGGAVFHTGGPLIMNGTQLDGNEADVAGAALYVKDLVDRNGAGADALIEGNSFLSNLARPAFSIVSADVGIDELGTDTGSISLGVTGGGSAIVVDGAGTVVADGNCFTGNGAPATATLNAGALNADGNWWGGAPGPVGDGDFAQGDVGVTLGTPLAAAADVCSSNPTSDYPLLFVPATVSADSAVILTDYRLTDAVRGTSVLNGASGDVVPDLRLGQLLVDVTGVNDALVEGVETFVFTITSCTDPGCAYVTNGQSAATFSITDDGDGASEGEGEGEGDACPETLSVSPTTMLLPDTGEASSASLTIKNDGPCAVQLRAPFVQSGASQGFAVKPIFLKDLGLSPGKTKIVIVTYTPPDQKGAATDAPPAGVLLIESAGGTLVPVKLGLVANCACASTHPGVPAGDLGLLGGTAAILVLANSKRRRAS